MSDVEVPGARLYYEVRGEGPLLAVVPGSRGEAGTYQLLAEQLQARYRVVTYDRRGFSRSELRGTQDYGRRLGTDTDDLRALINHLDGQQATVFGNGSGAIIALQLLAGHPGLVRTVVAHEPPVVTLLPDAGEWLRFFGDVYETYQSSGIPPAMRMYAARTFSDADRRAIHRMVMQPGNSQYLAPNTSYWMEHELRQYPAVDLDTSALAAHAGALVLACGRESRGQLGYRTTEALCGKLGLPMSEMAGGHLGCALESAQFATDLIDILATTGEHH